MANETAARLIETDLPARDREVVATLVNSIIRYVPREAWPTCVADFHDRVVADMLDRTLRPAPSNEAPAPASDGTAPPSETAPEEAPTPPEEQPRTSEKLPTPSDETVKKEIGVYKPVAWDDQPLGEVPDTELAKRLGVSNVAVGRARRRRGIPSFSTSAFNEAGADRRGGRVGIDWDAQPLGEMKDAELARRLGVHRSSVNSARRARGIPAARAERARPEAKRRPPPKVKRTKARPAESRQPRTDDGAPPHVHRCPECGSDTPCDSPDCEPKLETRDGTPMSYKTCEECVAKLSASTTKVPIKVGAFGGGL